MLNEKYLSVQAKLLGKMLIQAAKKGYDTDYLVKLVLTTDYGIDIMTDKNMIEWSDDYFMLEGYERNFELKRGKTYDEDVLYLAGYLYKYWVTKYNVSPKTVYELAPLSKIDANYGRLHTEGYDYMIEAFTDKDFDK